VTTLIVNAGQTSLEQLARINREESSDTLDRCAKPGLERVAVAIAQAAAGDAEFYGVNTGFGNLASMRIAPQDAAVLQCNLILSHCAGWGM
jgi:histidine ammonia-lyase